MEKAPRSRSGIAEKAVDVIVVEDDDDARTMIRVLLTNHDCIVRAYADAESAHEAALARVPDVVVSDLRLVGGSAGWTLAQALREDARTAHVALVAVSGAVEPERVVVSAFDAYLRKPVDTSLLVDLVKQLATISRTERRRGRAIG